MELNSGNSTAAEVAAAAAAIMSNASSLLASTNINLTTSIDDTVKDDDVLDTVLLILKASIMVILHSLVHYPYNNLQKQRINIAIYMGITMLNRWLFLVFWDFLTNHLSYACIKIRQ